MNRRPGLLGANVIGVLSATLAVPAMAVAQPVAGADERAAAIARPAVVVVEVHWHGWVRDTRTGEVFGGVDGYQVTASCTGFAVHADGHIVTAGHCVDPGPEGGGGTLFRLAARELVDAGRASGVGPAATALAEHAVAEGATDGSPVRREVLVHRGTVYGGQVVDDTLPAEVVDVLPASEGDVAVLGIDRGLLPALAVAVGDGPPVGASILAVGYPGAADQISDPTLEPSVKDGVVSNRRTAGGVPFYEVSASATGGMSGGPVIDHSGAVIGLVSHRPGDEGQGFTFVASASSILQLLDRAGVPHGLGPIDRNFQAGLDRYFAGRPAGAIVYFDAVLAASPTHQQATEFRRLAEHAEPQPADDTDPLLPWIVAAGAAAILFGIAGTALLLFRLSAPPPAR